MDNLDITRITIAIVLDLLFLVIIFVKYCLKKVHISTKFIVRTGIFSALATILYVIPYLKFPLPIFPNFLEIHLDEIPAFIAGFAYGPLSAFFVILTKTIIKLPMTTTACVGEVADFVYSVVFVIPAALIYKHKRTFKNALFSLSIATIIQLVVASLFTSFVMLNAYSFVLNIPLEAILKMCQAINPNITSLGWPFCFMVALPFNAIKDGIVLAVTILLYKRTKYLLDKISK